MTPEQITTARNVCRLIDSTHRAYSDFGAKPVNALELALGSWRAQCGVDFAKLDQARESLADIDGDALFEFECDLRSVGALKGELESTIKMVSPLRTALRSTKS